MSRTLRIGALGMLSVGLMGSVALAATNPPKGGGGYGYGYGGYGVHCKPGWGFGDKNHCHSGPPGHAKHDKHEPNGKPFQALVPLSVTSTSGPATSTTEGEHRHGGPKNQSTPDVTGAPSHHHSSTTTSSTADAPTTTQATTTTTANTGPSGHASVQGQTHGNGNGHGNPHGH